MEAMLTLKTIAEVNVTRMLRWHGEDNWSPSDWAVAAAGEMGEVCNAVKKLRRVEDGFANINDPGRTLATREAAIAAIGEEMADTVLYLLLLANKLGIDLEAETVNKFNCTSERYGFPDRLDHESTLQAKDAELEALRADAEKWKGRADQLGEETQALRGQVARQAEALGRLYCGHESENGDGCLEAAEFLWHWSESPTVPALHNPGKLCSPVCGEHAPSPNDPRFFVVAIGDLSASAPAWLQEQRREAVREALRGVNGSPGLAAVRESLDAYPGGRWSGNKTVPFVLGEVRTLVAEIDRALAAPGGKESNLLILRCPCGWDGLEADLISNGTACPNCGEPLSREAP